MNIKLERDFDRLLFSSLVKLNIKCYLHIFKALWTVLIFITYFQYQSLILSLVASHKMGHSYVEKSYLLVHSLRNQIAKFQQSFF